jgi:ribosome-binding ATPase YchF (GTP1/OBG family)
VGNRKWIVIYQKRVHFTVFYHFDSKKQEFYKQLIESSKQELKQSIVDVKKELMVLHDKQLKFLTKHLKKYLETKKVECKFSDLFVQPLPNYPVLYIFNKMDGELDQAREKMLKDLRNTMDDRTSKFFRLII